MVAVRPGGGARMSAWATSPQAAQIDAVIEQARRLTGDECDRLATAAATAAAADRDAVRFAAWEAAWFAARVADWSAAWVAAWEAAWDAARVADRSAARDPVWDKARDAVWDAAWEVSITAVALVVRDLIDEDTAWNRAAYDLLTGPWRRVIGPVHPDDEGASPRMDDAPLMQEGWRKVKRAKLDSRGRICLGNAARYDRYEVRVNDVGEFLLLPLVLALVSDVKNVVDLD